MKQISLLTLFLFLNSITTFAQTEVNLNIFHKLGDQEFAFNQTAENNLEHSFQIDRLEYYISEVSIVHDGGIETSIHDLYILANATETTSVDLGTFNIDVVEALKFHVGVDSEANYSDPASYDTDHPLAPKFPSMHWGWASGYRFVAIEGVSGPQLNQNFEIHSLGSQNYFQVTVPTNVEATDDMISIDINADYEKALRNIEINEGLINHGFDGEALALLLNFRSSVFSDASVVTSNDDLLNIDEFQIYPNPSDGKATLNLSIKELGDYDVNVQTILGTTIRSFEIQDMDSMIKFDLDHQGIYFISLIKAGKTILTEKLIVE